MNPKTLAGLVLGIAIGVGATCFAFALRRKPEPPAPPPASAPKLVAAPALSENEAELARLRQRNAELEAAAAAKTETPPAASAPLDAPSKESSSSDWGERFKELVEKGLAAYKGADFKKLVDELKKAGPRAIEELAKRLLNAESATERFMAAALLEDIGDAAAIPALTQSLEKDEDLLVRRMSSHAMAIIGSDGALAPLRSAMMGDADWGVRANAAYGVAKQGQADGLKLLEEAYASESTPAQYKLAVFGGLADVAAPSSAPIFRKILSESTDITYLFLSIRAVEKLKDRLAIADLNRIAADAKYSGNIREAAKKAAEAIAK